MSATSATSFRVVWLALILAAFPASFVHGASYGMSFSGYVSGTADRVSANATFTRDCIGGVDTFTLTAKSGTRYPTDTPPVSSTGQVTVGIAVQNGNNVSNWAIGQGVAAGTAFDKQIVTRLYYGGVQVASLTFDPGGNCGGAPIEAAVIIRVNNEDDRAWLYELAGNVGTVPAGGSVDLTLRKADFANGDVFARLSSYQTYSERVNPPADAEWWVTNTGSLVRPDAPGVDALTRKEVSFLAGPFSESQLSSPPKVFTVRIPKGTAAKNDVKQVQISDTETSDTLDPTETAAAQKQTEADVLDAVKTAVTDSDGNLIEQRVLPGFRFSSERASNEVYDKAVERAIAEASSRMEKLWEQGVVSDAKNTAKIVDAITAAKKSTDAVKTSTDAVKTAVDGVKTAIEAGGGGTGGGGGSADPDTVGGTSTEYGGDAATSAKIATQQAAASTLANQHALPTADGYHSQTSGRDLAFPAPVDAGNGIVINFNAFELFPMLSTWAAWCREVVLWLSAVMFVLWCQQKSDRFVASVMLSPQVSIADSADALLPGVAQGKAALQGAAIVGALLVCVSAMVALINSQASRLGIPDWPSFLSRDVAASMPAVGAGVTNGWDLVDRFVPLGALIQYLLLRVGFGVAIVPIYTAAAAVVRMIKV